MSAAEIHHGGSKAAKAAVAPIFETITSATWRRAVARARGEENGVVRRIREKLGGVGEFAAGKPANGKPSGQAEKPLAAPDWGNGGDEGRAGNGGLA